MHKWTVYLNFLSFVCLPFIWSQDKTNRDTLDLANDPSHDSPLRLIVNPTAFLKTFEDETDLGIRFGRQVPVLKDKCQGSKQKVNLHNFTFQLKGPIDKDKKPVTLINFDGLTGTNSFDFGYSFMSGPPVVPKEIERHLPGMVDMVISDWEAELKKLKAKRQGVMKSPEFPADIEAKVDELTRRIKELETILVNLRYKRAAGTVSQQDLPTQPVDKTGGGTQTSYKTRYKNRVAANSSITPEQKKTLLNDLVDQLIEEIEAKIKKLKTTKTDITNNPNFYPRMKYLAGEIKTLEQKLEHLRFMRADETFAMSHLPNDVRYDDDGNKLKSYRQLYREKLLEDQANARKVFGFNYQVGQKDFKYVLIEDITDIKKDNLEADKFTAFVGYMPGGTNFVDTNSFVGVNYQRQSYYKGQDVQELCQLAPISETETSDTVTACNSLALGEPEKKEEELVQFEYRRLIKNFGFSVRYTYNLDEKKWAASIPVYFIRASRTTLPNGGLALGYNNKDREITLSAFVGQGFKLF